jgi:subtilisin family serine protease
VNDYVEIMNIRIAYLTDFHGYGFLMQDLAAGIRYAANNGADIINFSLSSAEDNQEVRDAVRYAFDQNVLLVASSGNGPISTPLYPAAYDEVIAVGSIDFVGSLWRGSNTGNHIEFVAPGVNIDVLWKDGSIKRVAGTSYSSVLVAGVAGLIKAANPSLYAHEIRKNMQETAYKPESVEYSTNIGWGIPNAAEAIKRAKSSRRNQ